MDPKTKTEIDEILQMLSGCTGKVKTIAIDWHSFVDSANATVRGGKLYPAIIIKPVIHIEFFENEKT